MTDDHPRPVATPDVRAADAMWNDYRAAHPDVPLTDPAYTVDHFGDSARLCDELLDLVMSGRKRATADVLAAFDDRTEEIPQDGSHWIACDSTGTPRIVIRTTAVRIGPFTSADDAFAAAEGEDDGTLESWRREHRRYWQRTAAARGATWSEEDPIVFEEFAVVWPPELAAS